MACIQLGLDCKGYVPRFKFCEAESVSRDEHQTFKTIEWATILGPETGPSLPGTITHGLEPMDQIRSPAHSASLATSRDRGSQGPPSAAYFMEDDNMFKLGSPVQLDITSQRYIHLQT